MGVNEILQIICHPLKTPFPGQGNGVLILRFALYVKSKY